MNSYTFIYNYKFKSFGFSNEITVKSDTEANALELAKKGIVDVYGDNAKNLKRFSYKLKK